MMIEYYETSQKMVDRSKSDYHNYQGKVDILQDLKHMLEIDYLIDVERLSDKYTGQFVQ